MNKNEQKPEIFQTLLFSRILIKVISTESDFFILISSLSLYIYRRKWLPPPLRKLSQGKVDKTTAAAAPASSTASSSTVTPSDRPFLKKGSEKAFKLATSVTAEEEQPIAQKVTNISSRFRDKSNAADQLAQHQQQQQLKSDADQSQAPTAQSAEIENEEEVVLPPPMKPIQDSTQAIINNGPTVVASSVVEQSPCKRVSIFHNRSSI